METAPLPCNRCGTLPKQVRKVERLELIPYLLGLTRSGPEFDDTGWMDLEGPKGGLYRICPKCQKTA